MSMWRLTEIIDPPKPSPEGANKTIRVFAQDDPGSPGTLILRSIDSDGNVGDYVGPIGPIGPIGPDGPPGTVASQSVADINNPVEIESLTLIGIGASVFTFQTVGAGGADLGANYLYDANGPAKNAPFVMNTGDGGTSRWIAAVSRFTQTPSTAANGDRFITAAEITKLTSLSTVKEKFFSPNNDTANQDNYGVRSAGSTAQSFFSFMIPEDFVSLISLDIILFVQSTVGPVDIDLNSSYGLVGQDRIFNAESDTTTTYNFTADQIAEIDASVVFSSLVAGHICGLNVDHNGIGATAKYLGIKMRYNV